MEIDAFQELAWRAECPAPAIHIEILRAQTQLLRERPEGVSYFSIGSVAWASITTEQRREAFGLMLELYARTICTEHNDREHDEQLDVAAADSMKSYADVGDIGALWDSVQGSSSAEEHIEVERRSLLNVLSELELLQHRLAMRDPQTP